MSRIARSCSAASVTRLCVGPLMALLVLLAGERSVHDASASGDTRTLSFHHTHSGEDLTITFKRNGRYDEDSLKQLNHFLRDWRTQDQTVMDRHLFDILWEVYRDVGGRQPIQIISSYRSPATNAMLRHRSAHSGVARFSQHMLGHAMDFFIPGVPLEEIRFAGLRLQRGGVGFYPTSGSPFVHLDTGNVRHWPRMTREQLVRVFPNGRTVHIPADGKPLPGYDLALADLERRRADGDDAGSVGRPSLLASLVSNRQGDDDDESPSLAEKIAPTSMRAAPPALAAVETQKADAAVPMPRIRPAAATYRLAAAGTPSELPAAASAEPAKDTPRTADGAPQTPADIINARGFWGDDEATPHQATPAQIAALAARNAFASAEPPAAASVSPPAKALAYAPARTIERTHVVTASLPAPRGLGLAAPVRAAITDTASIVAKVRQHAAAVSNAARIAPANNTNAAWMRAMIVTPSATRAAMLATSLGDQDMTTLRHFFVKPETALAMAFADDPQMGMSCEHFSGAAIAPLVRTSFVQTAALPQ